MSTAFLRTGVVAVGHLSFWTYRCLSRGEALSSKRLLYGVLLILASFVVVLTWQQAVSKVKGWSWWMTFLGYTLSMIFVSIVVATGLRLMA